MALSLTLSHQIKDYDGSLLADLDKQQGKMRIILLGRG